MDLLTTRPMGGLIGMLITGKGDRVAAVL
jgi:hypothetical protein